MAMKCTRSVVTATVIFSLGTLRARQTNAAPALIGATLFSAEADGNFFDRDYWNTRGLDLRTTFGLSWAAHRTPSLTVQATRKLESVFR